MPSTMTLLAKALEKQRAAAWARTFNITESAFAQAKKRQRLSPTLAGKLAHELGEDETQWIAIAGLEAEPQSEERDAMLMRLATNSLLQRVIPWAFNSGPKTGLRAAYLGRQGFCKRSTAPRLTPNCRATEV